MPIVTSAVVAVTAAIATTTVATVAAAAVAVSTLVATVGLAVTAVGMVTGNQDLMKAGNIMGMVGLAGGVAGMGVGALASASSAAPSVANTFANPELAASITGSIEQAGKVGAGTVLAPATVNAAQVGAGSVLAPAGQGMINVTPGAQAIPVGASKSVPTAPLGETVPQAGVTAPSAGTTAPAAPLAGTTAPAVGQAVTDTMTSSAVGASKVQSWWDKVPDWQKAQLMTTGAQGVAGLAGGFFEGLTAEEKIELDRLINSQNETQRQRLNTNSAYAPSLAFKKTGTGMINAGGR